MSIPSWQMEERELLADLETPVSAFLKLRSLGARYLLETVESGAVLGRYSFLGLHPLLELTWTGEQLWLETANQERFEAPPSSDPGRLLQAVLELLVPPTSDLPGNLLGGAVGYLGYDFVACIEDVPVRRDPEGPAAGRFLIPQSLVTFDHLRRKLYLRSMQADAWTAPTAEDPLAATARAAVAAALGQLVPAARRMAEMEAALADRLPATADAPRDPFQPVAHPSREEFERRVEQAREEIHAGEIFQVVLSQQLRGPCGLDPFQVYRALRILNPSPYLFFLDFEPTVLVGSSPELLVKLDGRQATVRPIAGTRPRGDDELGDQALAEELLGDEKERAEHVMLVDLGRNDLGRVCEYGSVEVADFMTLEKYSHVMHLVSYVRGRLRRELDRFDLLRATFPAGTVSGAPKVRAMEIIHELEQEARGPYAGAVGYLGPQGEMDLCIAIRSIVFHRGEARLQAGAGIVADSQPAHEHRECQGKMQALVAAMRRAEEGLR